MTKEVPAFLRAEIGNDAADPTQEPQNRMLGRLAQMRLEFAEGQLDRVEVRRILRKINQRRARCFDRLRNAGDLVGLAPQQIWKIDHRTGASAGSPRFRQPYEVCDVDNGSYVLDWLFNAEEAAMLQTVSRLLPELPLILVTAVATHLVMSFAQTLMHYKLGHHPMGGKFFRNHINFHHVHYCKDHLVSRTYLGDEGNNTPFFFIPVLLVGACTYLVLPVDLFLAQLVACAASFYAHVFFDKEYHIEGSRLQRFAWFRRKQELHFVHHRHANSNFAVIHFFWDRILGTYRRPDAAQTQANGTLRTGGLGRFPRFEADSSV
jgi:Fatty acid hydroxylase